MGKVRNLSIIDSDFRIEGALHASGCLVIKGSVKGTLAGSTVVIAEDGRVYCDATVEEITIGGIFEGSIQARERVIILATGRCSGTVVCKDLVVESGGLVNAEVTSTRDREIPQGHGDQELQEKEDIPLTQGIRNSKIRKVL